jgi:hypothetical protein
MIVYSILNFYGIIFPWWEHMLKDIKKLLCFHFQFVKAIVNEFIPNIGHTNEDLFKASMNIKLCDLNLINISRPMKAIFTPLTMKKYL